MTQDHPRNPETWRDRLRGRFLVFDGPDGSGKTTQLARFARFAEWAGVAVRQLRDPGGTELGEKIRELLLDPSHDTMTLRAEMLLYMASRAQLVAEGVRPAIEAGELVLCDRFVSATLAYQGAGGGLPEEPIRTVAEIALEGTHPDLTILFDVDEHTAAKRLAGSPKKGKRTQSLTLDEPTLFSDRMELKGAAYHRKVREGYRAQAERDPEGVALIDASAEAERVFQTVLERLDAHLPAAAADARAK